jgi:hypothetical protein
VIIFVLIVGWGQKAERGEEAEWDSSSVGRALVSHIRGQGFNSPLFHIFTHRPRTNISSECMTGWEPGVSWV